MYDTDIGDNRQCTCLPLPSDNKCDSDIPMRKVIFLSSKLIKV